MNNKLNKHLRKLFLSAWLFAIIAMQTLHHTNTQLNRSIVPYINKTVVLDSIEDNIDGKYLKF